MQMLHWRLVQTLMDEDTHVSRPGSQALCLTTRKAGPRERAQKHALYPAPRVPSLTPSWAGPACGYRGYPLGDLRPFIPPQL